MGMDVIVQGIKSSKGKKFQDYLKIFKACEDAQVAPPKEVKEFFAGSEESVPDGILADIDEAISAYSYEEFEAPNWKIDLNKVPKDVNFIFVWLSY